MSNVVELFPNATMTFEQFKQMKGELVSRGYIIGHRRNMLHLINILSSALEDNSTNSKDLAVRICLQVISDLVDSQPLTR